MLTDKIEVYHCDKLISVVQSCQFGHFSIGEVGMALTKSTMLALGTKAPDFELLDTVSGKTKSLAELKSPVATVIVFMCNHCPFVKHILDHFVSTTNKYSGRKVTFIAISANDINNYPEDAPHKMQKLAQSMKFSFPYLYDESQEVAKAYDAACTPDFYIFDADMKLVYRGQYDDSRPETDKPVTGECLTAALDAILSGKSVSAKQLPSMGCNIKWK